MWIDEFIECFNGVSKDDLQFEKAFAIKHQNLPSFIYKYREFGAYGKENLATDTVWLDSADKYNDPYDSAMTVSFERLISDNFKQNLHKMLDVMNVQILPTDGEIDIIRGSSDPVTTILELILLKDKSISLEEIPGVLSVLKKASEQMYKPLLEQLSKTIQSNTVLCSFSTVPDSIIMWEHYSGKHTGFCIEYALETIGLNDIRRRMLFPVIYSDELFDATRYLAEIGANVKNFNNTFGTLPALYKSTEWRYENEWRLLFPGGVLKPGNYQMPTPSRVLLGSRMLSTDKEVIMAICRQKNIECWQMHLSGNTFQLKAEKILWPRKNLDSSQCGAMPDGIAPYLLVSGPWHPVA